MIAKIVKNRLKLVPLALSINGRNVTNMADATLISKWGFIRETREIAQKAGIDKDTGCCRTGIEDYLAAIYPEISEEKWIHDTAFGMHGGHYYRIRPDYRCDELMMIVEIDGLPHYKNLEQIERDIENQAIYEKFGYKVVRIPYFIQLSKDAVKTLFGVSVKEELFPDEIPSMGVLGNNTPAYCCPEGIARMAREIVLFPKQMKANIAALEAAKDEYHTGVQLLKEYIANKEFTYRRIEKL